jgi:pimeloyl-ACP methyl ester carboxylesterase
VRRAAGAVLHRRKLRPARVSRSRLDGPEDYENRLDTDADDLYSLIEHLGGAPATVVGFSSGATVALQLLTRHPQVVATVVAFEPPAMRLLPDGQKWLNLFHHLYDVYRQAGAESAIMQFRERILTVSDRTAMEQAMNSGPDISVAAQVRANLGYWFDHELRQYPAADLNLAFGDRDDDLMNTDASQILSTLLMDATRVRLHETAPAGKRRSRPPVLGDQQEPEAMRQLRAALQVRVDVSDVALMTWPRSFAEAMRSWRRLDSFRAGFGGSRTATSDWPIPRLS